MEDIAFVLAVYKDGELAKRLIRQIRKWYSHAPIVVCADGVDPEIPHRFFDYYAVTYHYGRRLKTLNNGGLWTQRLLNLGLIPKTELLIKLDPDTQVWRPFIYYPAELWFGTLDEEGVVRGGCWGMRRSLVERIVNSGLLLNEQYQRSPYWYDRYGVHAWAHEHERREKISCQDLILADVVNKLGVQPVDWPEVCIQFRDPVINPLQYAATHPHPTLDA